MANPVCPTGLGTAVSETTRPASFMPSNSPQRQSLEPITRRPLNALEYTTRSHRSGR